MPLEPRHQELLERYPAELDDAELAELRSEAKAHPELEALMDGLHGVDASLNKAVESPQDLSPAAEEVLDALVARLDPALTETEGSPTSPLEAAEDSLEAAPEQEPPMPSGEEPGLGLPQAPAANEAVWPAGVPLTSAAAGLVLGIGLVLGLGRPASVPVDGAASPLTDLGELTARGSAAPKVQGTLFVAGAPQPEEPQRERLAFRAVVSGALQVVLTEDWGDGPQVVVPHSGSAPVLRSGSNVLPVAGQLESYHPGKSGDATYRLFARVGEEAATPDPPGLATLGSSEWPQIDEVHLRWEATENADQPSPEEEVEAQ